MADALVKPDPKGRLAAIRESLVDIHEDDARNVGLARHMFKTDEQLLGAGLAPHDIAKVRNWEMSRKEAAAGLMASAARVEAISKAGEERGATFNIERAVIQIPAPGAAVQAMDDAVYIDVVPGQ